MHYIIASMMLDIHKHYVLLLFYLVTEELKALQSHSKAVTQPKGYVCLTLAPPQKDTCAQAVLLWAWPTSPV